MSQINVPYILYKTHEKRIKRILREIKKKSIKNNIDPKITARIWRSMIWSYVDYQKRKFNKK